MIKATIELLHCILYIMHKIVEVRRFLTLLKGLFSNFKENNHTRT